MAARHVPQVPLRSQIRLWQSIWSLQDPPSRTVPLGDQQETGKALLGNPRHPLAATADAHACRSSGVEAAAAASHADCTCCLQVLTVPNARLAPMGAQENN